ncbi:MAG: phosphatidate cytidylyltransferase [Kiritimatiellae bacterium]|jgi:phosphatidate cytidylyltransferase|nr:phosphatidate cytidylyltransferase [Kiritimatiellia bacterium]
MNPTLKRTLTGIAVGLAVVSAILFAPPPAIAPAVGLLVFAASVEYFLLLKKKLSISSFAFILSLLAGVAIIACSLSALPIIAGKYGEEMRGCFNLGNLMLLYVIAVIKFSDVGGFAFGVASAKLMKGGNHKLCPTISPNKSIEGLIGSILFSSLMSLAFTGITGFAPLKSLAIGVGAALIGTTGDLIESKFKRWVGVKDSSAMKITNGMGGFLDMLDSLLIAPASLLFFL